jgi:RNA polymerase sigma-70 factor (ECF subfamily)
MSCVQELKIAQRVKLLSGQKESFDLVKRVNHPAFVSALIAGDERTFRQLVRLYQDRIYNLCYRLLGVEEEAKDVAQEIFITVYRKISSFAGNSKLSTWLYRVATNHALNRIKFLKRRRYKQMLSFETEVVEGISNIAIFPQPDQVLAAKRLETYIQSELNNLDKDQRTVVVLRDMEGLTYQEIAQITGLNGGTVKSRLHRGRARLKEALEHWFEMHDVLPQRGQREGQP